MSEMRSDLVAPCGMNCRLCYAYQREKNHCEGFPCLRMKQLDKRYRTKYHMSMIENLQMIEQNGMNAFLQQQGQRWTCPACGSIICVHKAACLDCKS